VKIAVASLLFFALCGGVSAQTVSENWLKQVGVTCGGGISEETRQEVEEKVRESLEISSNKEEKVFKTEDVQSLLSAFSADAKGDAYSQYIECITSVIEVSIKSASKTEGKDVKEIALDAPPPPEEIEVISGSANLTVRPGDFFGLRSEDLMFFVREIKENNGDTVMSFEYTDIESGINRDGNATEGAIIDPRLDCVVIPYRIDLATKLASIKVKC
jgi:hypothetical protein